MLFPEPPSIRRRIYLRLLRWSIQLRYRNSAAKPGTSGMPKPVWGGRIYKRNEPQRNFGPKLSGDKIADSVNFYGCQACRASASTKIDIQRFSSIHSI